MNTALVAAIRESGGYLEDEGWYQTAQLMTLAAEEIERLTARIEELEGRSRQREFPPAEETLRIVHRAAGSRPG